MTSGVSIVLMSILILTVANFAFMGDSFSSSLFKLAYAQTPDPGANPDPTAGDNSTDMGMPSDNSTDLGMPNDNSTDLGSASIDPSADLGMPTDNIMGTGVGDNLTGTSTQSSNLTSNTAVPEFGPLASIVLVFSVLSILVFSAKTKLKF